MAKILLFNPSGPGEIGFTREGRCTQEADTWGTVWPPLSLATAAAMLEEDGHQVRVIDFSARLPQRESLAEVVQTMKPDFTIWPTGTPTLSFDLNIAQLIKENYSPTVTCVFGTHVTIDPEGALSNSCIDAVIRGEPEAIIRNLCRSAQSEWKDIDGISFRDQATGSIWNNKDAALIEPSKIPAPAWHLLDLHGYRLPLKNRKFLIVAPIRGCPYSCSFCTAAIYYGKKPRYRPVEKVIDEIEGSVSRYDIKDYFIWADTFTVNRKYVQDFCRTIIDRRLSIAWTCNSRVDTLDEEMLILMKRAGLWMISFGIEAGDNEILAATGKRITVEQSRQAVQLANRLGIKTAGHFIFGLPGETSKTMKETLNLALSLPLDIAQFYAATPFPGTRLYEEAASRGWLASAFANTRPSGKMSFRVCPTGKSRTWRMRNLNPRRLLEAGFLASLRNDKKIDSTTTSVAMSQSKAVMELPGLTGKDIDACRRLAYRKFYLRPRTLYGIWSMFDPWAQMKSLFSG
jgi:anaerobic magnesium-protoporphyrin IX monomethyl ester cyclase